MVGKSFLLGGLNGGGRLESNDDGGGGLLLLLVLVLSPTRLVFAAWFFGASAGLFLTALLRNITSN